MSQSIDQKVFKRLLLRNVVLPLGLAVLTGGIFAGLIVFMLESNRWIEHSDLVVSRANHIQKLIIDAETGVRGFVITADPLFIEPFNHAVEKVPDEFSSLKELVSDNSTQVGQIAAVQEFYVKWYDYANEVLNLVKKNKMEAQHVVVQARGKAMMDNIRSLLTQFIQTEENLRVQRMAAATENARLILSIVVIISILLGVVLAFMGRKQLLNLSRNYEESLSNQVEQNQRLEEQKWIAMGRTELSQRMQGEIKLSDLATRVLDYLTRYLGAQIGVLHVANEQGLFEGVSSHAISAEEALQKSSFQSGEGILGQAVKDGKLMQLNDIDDNYLKIKSTLGEMKPRHILVVPCSSDQAPNTLIELGFLQDVPKKVLEFFHEATVSISVAIKSARYRERLERLYREVQNQAEELQAQQEELRVNNEELEEQTKLLKEAQVRLESQHAELEQSNTQLEEQAQELERQKEYLSLQNDRLNQAQEQLENKANELQRASQYKSEFLANMSHELRTPLNSSLILAKLLADNKEKNLSSKQVEFAEQIMNSGHDLLNLINDILDLSKVESGKLDIFAEDVQVGAMIESLQKIFQPISRQKNLEFNVHIAEGVPATIFTDRLRVEQVLKNLLSNAFKFTQQGHVELTVAPISGRPRFIEFTVADSGIGIPKEQQEIIFEAFRQADGTTNRKFGGTGLGLSISRDLSRLLGGSIKVDSQPKVGSKFHLTLPIRFAGVSDEDHLSRTAPVKFEKHEIPEYKAKTSEKSGNSAVKEKAVFVADDRGALHAGEKQVLIIEDDPEFAKIIFDLAHEQKFQAVVAGNAEDALDAISTYKFHAILLDVNLPDHSGLFVLDTLKQNPKTRHIPVHMVSGHDFTQRALEMGAIGYMLKPVKREELESAFHKLEAKMNQNIKKVLVIEDDPGQREAICRLIEDNQIQTTAVAYGSEALKVMSTATFDCLIMDLSLPDMSGFDLLDQIKRDEKFQGPPVIIYTGRDLSRQEEEKLRRHSHSLIIKGASSPDRLLNEVTLFLHKVEANLGPERQQLLEHLRSREKIFEEKTILIVDDDIRNVFALTAALEQKGAHVVIARDGAEALQKLEEVPVNLVLMDIMMPNMNGYEAMAAIRKQPRLAKLPIIALTAKAMKDDRELCLKAGANDYLAKPVDVEKLLSLIRVWMSYGDGR